MLVSLLVYRDPEIPRQQQACIGTFAAIKAGYCVSAAYGHDSFPSPLFSFISAWE
jgi:hypothetical protein